MPIFPEYFNRKMIPGLQQPVRWVICAGSCLHYSARSAGLAFNWPYFCFSKASQRPIFGFQKVDMEIPIENRAFEQDAFTMFARRNRQGAGAFFGQKIAVPRLFQGLTDAQRIQKAANAG